MHEPRGLSLLQAGQYVGMGPALFVALVKMGKMPKAKLIGTQMIWDCRALDAAFDDLPQELNIPSPPPTTPEPVNRPIQIHVPPPTKAEIAAVILRMDMERYGQSTVGMSAAQIEKLEEQWRERWRRKVIGSPLNKREKAALRGYIRSGTEFSCTGK